VTPDMDIYASEIFGPATVIHPVESTGAAIELANGSQLFREIRKRGHVGSYSVVPQLPQPAPARQGAAGSPATRPP
jgi:hypothetical protein